MTTEVVTYGRAKPTPSRPVMRMAVMNHLGEVIDRQRRPLATRQELATLYAEVMTALAALDATKAQLLSAIEVIRTEVDDIADVVEDALGEDPTTDDGNEPDFAAIFDSQLTAP